MGVIAALSAGLVERSQALGRPVVTLSYAQSLDGSLTLQRGERLALSGAESKLFTHQLRAVHDAILIGIGTLLADDPKLTARLADGPHPRPVVLDSRLRIPLTSKLMLRKDQPALVVCGPAADAQLRLALQKAGAEVLTVDCLPDGRLNLQQVLQGIFARSLFSVMVEGGARVITSFLQSGLVDQAAVTISPRWVGGLPAVENGMADSGQFPVIMDPTWECFGRDMVVWGRVQREVYEAQSAVFHPAGSGGGH